jgi:hypothetical protein
MLIDPQPKILDPAVDHQDLCLKVARELALVLLQCIVSLSHKDLLFFFINFCCSVQCDTNDYSRHNPQIFNSGKRFVQSS